MTIRRQFRDGAREHQVPDPQHKGCFRHPISYPDCSKCKGVGHRIKDGKFQQCPACFKRWGDEPLRAEYVRRLGIVVKRGFAAKAAGRTFESAADPLRIKLGEWERANGVFS